MVEGTAEARDIALQQIADEKMSATALCKIGNFGDASSQFKWRNRTCEDGHSETAPVGSFEPNAFGVYDLAGNVWEWVGDCWSEDGPSGVVNNCKGGTLRGGSFDDPIKNASPETRQGVPVVRRQTNIGFRIARDID